TDPWQPARGEYNSTCGTAQGLRRTAESPHGPFTRRLPAAPPAAHPLRRPPTHRVHTPDTPGRAVVGSAGTTGPPRSGGRGGTPIPVGSARSGRGRRSRTGPRPRRRGSRPRPAWVALPSPPGPAAAALTPPPPPAEAPGRRTAARCARRDGRRRGTGHTACRT